MSNTKVIAAPCNDTLTDDSGVWSTPATVIRSPDATLVDGLTLVGSLVPCEPIRLAKDIGNFSFSAADLVAELGDVK